jgi:hypothetical protein
LSTAISTQTTNNNSLSTRTTALEQKTTRMSFTGSTTTFSGTTSLAILSFTTSINSISPTTFAFLNGVTSNIQTQINTINTTVSTNASNTNTQLTALNTYVFTTLRPVLNNLNNKTQYISISGDGHDTVLSSSLVIGNNFALKHGNITTTTNKIMSIGLPNTTTNYTTAAAQQRVVVATFVVAAKSTMNIDITIPVSHRFVLSNSTNILSFNTVDVTLTNVNYVIIRNGTDVAFGTAEFTSGDTMPNRMFASYLGSTSQRTVESYISNFTVSFVPDTVDDIVGNYSIAFLYTKSNMSTIPVPNVFRYEIISNTATFSFTAFNATTPSILNTGTTYQSPKLNHSVFIKQIAASNSRWNIISAPYVTSAALVSSSVETSSLEITNSITMPCIACIIYDGGFTSSSVVSIARQEIIFCTMKRLMIVKGDDTFVVFPGFEIKGYRQHDLSDEFWTISNVGGTTPRVFRTREDIYGNVNQTRSVRVYYYRPNRAEIIWPYFS